jgi:hypothetical protein
MGKIFINIGIIFLIIGIIIRFANKLGIKKLPGDIVIKGENFSFYFPIVTCIIVSIVLSLIFSLFRRF